MNTSLIIYSSCSKLSVSSSGITHFLILFTRFSHILDHLPCSWLLTVIFLSLHRCLFTQLLLPFPLSMNINFVLIYKSFLLCTFLSCGSISSTGEYFTWLQNITHIIPDYSIHTQFTLIYVLKVQTFKIFIGWAFQTKLGCF